MTAPSSLAILTVAGGRGSRAGEGIPKQYRPLLGETLLARTLKALHAAAPQAVLLTVIHADDRALYDASVARASRRLARNNSAAGHRRRLAAGRASAMGWRRCKRLKSRRKSC